MWHNMLFSRSSFSLLCRTQFFSLIGCSRLIPLCLNTLAHPCGVALSPDEKNIYAGSPWFFWDPKKPQFVLCVHLFFFRLSRKTQSKSQIGICFRAFLSHGPSLSVHVVLGSVVMCMERWQKPQWTVPCLQTSCQQTFRVATFVALRNSAIHSAPAVISEIRSPSANVKSKGPKKFASIPRPQVFQCSVFCQLSGRFGPTALAVRCPLWSRLETSAMFETL